MQTRTPTGTDKTHHAPSSPPVPQMRAATPAPMAAQESGAVAQAQPSAVPVQDLPAGVVVGEYRVEHKLGEGGMGAVYAAVHPLIGKKAAIKVISPQLCTDAAAVERFVQEAASVNKIGHPNIVDIFAFGALADGRSYFVMEWLQGDSLADRLAKGNMTLGEAVEILDQVADALEAAHEKGIVHRDLKPDNVFLVHVRGNRQLVKLLDFGIAKLAAGDVRMQKTATGMMMGTPGYISPEQARGKNVDNRTDIYAFGCMAYEMLLGRLPFVAESAMDVVLKHLTEAPPPPRELWPEVPEPVEKLLLGLLEKAPEARPSLHDVRVVLGALRGQLLATMAQEGGAGFASGFGPRAITPAGTPMRMSTPLPGAMSTAAATTPGVPRAVTPAPGATSMSVEEALPVAGGGKGKLILGVVVALALVGGGAAFALLGGGSSSDGKQATVAEAKPEQPVEPPQPEKQVQPPPEPVKPPPPPPPKRGTLVVVVSGGSDAVVELDGKKIGTGAKVSIEVEEGDHEVVVSAPGKKTETRKVTIAAGAKAEVPIKLEREKRAGGGGKSGGKTGDGKSGDGKTGDGKTGDGGQGGQGKKPPVNEDYTIDPFTGEKVKVKK